MTTTEGARGRSDLVAAACRRIEAAPEDAPPSLAELAAGAGLSPARFQKRFKAELGISPKRYALALRDRRFRAALEDGASVTAAIHAAGFGSSSRAYAGGPRRLGMTPSAYRRGAPGLRIRYALADSSLGRVLVAATDAGVCAIQLGDDDAALVTALRERFSAAALEPADDPLAALVEAVTALVEAPGSAADLPLDVRGTAFQQRVWDALRRIPPGETVTYAELARRLGAPRATRAVAGACGANRLAVAIPCHRVVRSDGGLGGYRWGVERKQRLLEREAGRERSARVDRPDPGARA